MDQEVLKAVELLRWSAWWFAIKMAVVFIAAMFIKSILENYVEYLLFRSNGQLNVGNGVNINGKDGLLAEVNHRFITVIIMGGDRTLIPIRQWRHQVWVIKDQYKCIYEVPDNPQRRKEDTKESL